MRYDVLILGGGISGLTLGYSLLQEGVDVCVLEASSRPGGTIWSERKEGFLIEHGPNTALLTQQAHLDLFQSLGLRERLAFASETANHRFILKDRRLIELPMSLMAFLKTPLFSAKAKVRVALEPFHRRAEQEETLAEFVKRRLGQEFLDYAIDPFVSGVYAGDPETLSVREAFPKLYGLEERYGGLILGTFLGARERKKRPDTAKVKARLFSFLGGMAELPLALASRLGNGLVLKATAHGLRPLRDGFEVSFRQQGVEQTIASKKLVLSVPAYEAVRLLKGLNASLAQKLQAIPYPPVAQVALGYRLDAFERPPEGFGFLIPKREGRSILGALFSSSFLPGRASEGFALLTTFVGGMRAPSLALLEANGLADLAHKEVSDILRIKEEPTFAHVGKIERAIPQYTLGHGEMIKEIEALEHSLPGLHFLANYRGGIALGDCLANAADLSSKILRQISSRPV